jgi:hypothetical protein
LSVGGQARPHQKYFGDAIHSVVEVHASAAFIAAHEAVFRKVATLFRADFKFTWTDADESDLAKRYYKVQEIPCVMAVHFDHKKQKFHRYVMPAKKWGDGDGNKATELQNFVQQVLDGKWNKHYKSEEVFAKGEDVVNGVQVVVGKNFHGMVYRKDQVQLYPG